MKPADHEATLSSREWQTCPKCGGQGYVNKPPYIAGDQESWVANNTGGFKCPVCHGFKMVMRP